MVANQTEPAHVLLIYPPGDSARGMSETLRSEGFTVNTVGNVFEAVSRFTSQPAELVVVGIADLDERDIEVVRVLREVRPSVYILLAFPGNLRDRAVKALAFGADSYILEPFYLGELLDLVRRGVERARAGRTGPSRAGVREDDLERLAGAVAHAINNPLQILELLLSEGADSAPDPKEIRQETRRILEVVDELLGFARRGEFHPRPVDLNRLITETLPRPRGRKRRVLLDLDKGIPEVPGDERGLRSVIKALAGVATAREGSGRLEVTTRLTEKEAGWVAITFRAPELLLTATQLESFFRPFGGPVPGAVGLVTATARAVIEAHGGSTALESREGEGTTVTVRLPLALALAPADEQERGRVKGG